MDINDESIKIISLCTGIGGLERGIKRTGWPIRTVCYVEIEAFICANLVAGMEAGLLDEAPIWTNLKTFDGKPFRNKIHGIIGGYPCQPFSNAGLRKGLDDPRHLYPFISGIIEATRPIFCFFENVEGHLAMGYDTVYKDLRRMGYKVEAGIYSAEEVGAPHQRNRLFILAVLDDAHGELKRRLQFRKNEKYTLFGKSSEMGNSSIKGLQESRQTRIGQLQAEGGVRIYNRPEQSSIKELADTSIQGLQRGELTGTSIEGIGESKSHGSTSECSNDLWPARPGQQQYDWENPRAQPSICSTVNGYNYREDFLRALGNSVVEQTAEIAFVDLLHKHISASLLK